MSSVRPGSRLGGLPPNPRARSVSRARVSTDVDPAHSTPSEPLPSKSATARLHVDPRSLRSQRSLAGLPARSQPPSPSSARAPRPSYREPPSEPRSRSYSRAPDEDDRAPKPMPPLPVSRARSRLRERPSTRSLRSVGSSPASEVSSTFDRAPWDNSGESSPRTSLESADVPRSKTGKSGLPNWVGNDDDYKLGEPEPAQESSTAAGLGAKLWARVAEVSSNLTISVGQAWASNVPVYDGEVTPPGGESRLTRAMKAYHLSNVKSQADLPEWLFTDVERGMRSSQRSKRGGDQEEREGGRGERDLATAMPMPSRGLRDTPRPIPMSSSARSEPDLQRAPTKATDRLRALRDAKRSAAMPSYAAASSPASSSERGYDGRGSRADTYVKEDGYGKDALLPSRPPVKIGLPSRPGAVRRV